MSRGNVAFELAMAEFSVPDPGTGKTIIMDRYGAVCEMVSGASNETRTLMSPLRAGLRATLRLLTDGGGDVAVTSANGFNVTGNTIATFGDVGDQLDLLSVSTATAGTYRWEIIVNTGSVSMS